MTAHDRASRLIETLTVESQDAPFLRPSAIEHRVEDAIRLAEVDLRDAILTVLRDAGQTEAVRLIQSRVPAA